MLAVRDNLVQCFSALRAHKLRASLTMLGLTMGVATLITVMTIVQGANFYGQTPSMADIDTRTVEFGRYFTVAEAEHRADVCLIGDTLVQQLFLGMDPIGKGIRVGNDELMVIGVIEKIGSVLGQDQDNF